MPNCAAINCTNRTGNNKSKENVDDVVVFFKIPSAEKKNELRKRWSHNIRRTGPLPKDSGFYICSTHFEPDCFERDLQAIT